jgi:hypothetical protein
MNSSDRPWVESDVIALAPEKDTTGNTRNVIRTRILFIALPRVAFLLQGVIILKADA